MNSDPGLKINGEKYGRDQPTGDGVLVLDKPKGFTSHAVVQQVKKTLGASKAGHSGTLDPLATGVLVVLINGATKLTPFLASHEKTYRFSLYFGVETDTLDSTGRVVKQVACKQLQEREIKEACAGFTGEVMQTVPRYSAVRVGGQRLYRLARRGIEMNPPSRKVQIKKLTLCELDWPEATFEVTCSRGTYVRSLGVDLARSLKCNGHISQLRRLSSDGFDLNQAVTLEQLEGIVAAGKLNRVLITTAEALKAYPELRVSHLAAKRIRQGVVLDSRQFLGSKVGRGWMGGPIKVLDPDNNLVAMVSESAKAVKNNRKREIIFKTLRVFGSVS